MVWNSVVLVAFIAGWAYFVSFTTLSAPMRITTLDRAGVLDEAKLREAYPDLAVNFRLNLGMWVAQKERQAASRAALMGTTAAVVNILLVLLLRQAKRHPSNNETDSS